MPQVGSRHSYKCQAYNGEVPPDFNDYRCICKPESAAEALGIPPNPPGHVHEVYVPPAPKGPPTIEDRLAALEYQVEVLTRALQSARASIPSVSMHGYHCWR
jgi:hypothetical protein